MVVCKIVCPKCGTNHEVPFDKLDKASVLECNVCGNEFALKSEEKPADPKEKKQPRKTQRNLKNSKPVPKKKTAKRPVVQRKKSESISSKYVVNVCIVGLVLILVSIAGYKLLGSKSKQAEALAHHQEVKEAVQEINTTNIVKNELADLKKQLLAAQKNKEAQPVAKAAAVDGNVVLETYNQSDSTTAVAEITEVVVSPTFAQPPVEVDIPAESRKRMSNAESAATEVSVVQPSANMILIESEQNDLDELSKLPDYKLTAEERITLNELKSKYQWYKANRFKMNREQMDEAWERRWAQIISSNMEAQGRTDAMLPRPLQILLEGAETVKERAYMMRIFQKPVSFEEKEIVRKARNQAIWERRKSEGPIRYPEDASKKRNQKYVDEFGYEYYLDEKGQRVYL